MKKITITIDKVNKITIKTIKQYSIISYNDVKNLALYQIEKEKAINDLFYYHIDDKINMISDLIKINIALKKLYVNNGIFEFNEKFIIESIEFSNKLPLPIDVLLSLKGNEYKSIKRLYKQFLNSDEYTKAKRNINFIESINHNLRFLEKKRKKYLYMKNHKIGIYKANISHWDINQLFQNNKITYNLRRVIAFYYRMNRIRFNYNLNLNIERIKTKFLNDFFNKL